METICIYALDGREEWVVTLALEENFEMFGLTGILPDYPLTDRNQTTYDPILETINGKPVLATMRTFDGCTSLVDPPVIPKSVMLLSGTFNGCTSLRSDTNIYSFSAKIDSGSTLDSITNYTTDYKSLNKTVFLKHNIGSLGRVESQEVCYILNGNKYCLKGGGVYNEETRNYESPHYETNKATLLESFGEENCSVYSKSVECSLSGLYAKAHSSGAVDVNDDSSLCYVLNNGSAYCN